MKSADEAVKLRDNETVENLGGGYRIIQGRDEFRFGTDAVKLADFTVVRPGERVMDLCTGTGIVPLLLHRRVDGLSLIGLEIQPQMVDIAQRSVKLNNFTDDIEIIQGDLREIKSQFAAESFHAVTCNPPYMKNDTGKQNRRDSVSIARHEVCCTLEDCIVAAAYLLRSGGRFYMVHRPERLTDVMALMRRERLEPKRLALYAKESGSVPRLMVIEGQKNRKSGLIVSLHTGEDV
ncbi:MAG: methyltransferase domain-containing protein [Ruminococcaceae bacterium]|nr:methyltransferase domain-containing protein [Oscillospiraceae bacterium]